LQGKYVPVNVSNKDTVEIRIFRGTINPKRILANLEIVAGAVAYTRFMKVSEVAAGGLHYKPFCAWLFEHDCTYPNAAKLLKGHTALLHLTGRQLSPTAQVAGYECDETAREEVISCVS
jgi:hypothetical protein